MLFLKTIMITWMMHVMLTSNVIPFYAQFNNDKQYQVKAAFLCNFAEFVEWPESSFQHADAPIVIGVVGKDPFGPYLEEIFSGKEIRGHPLAVKRFNHKEEIRDCHILFINVASKNKTIEIIENVKEQSILTVSDMPGFIQNGGIIKFITVSNKIKFQINPEASKSSNLIISSNLLQLAEIVTPNE
jgi:hypothetical protein